MANHLSSHSATYRTRHRKSRIYNVRLIRRDYSYTVQEIAELFNLHPNAVRRWLRDGGLRTIDASRPQLIHGSDLIDFLSRKQLNRKRGCAPDEMYCFKCREPRHPASGRVTVADLGPTRVFLQGTCELCGTRMNRALTAARLPELERVLSIRTASSHLDGTSSPIDMCDLAARDQL
jgi:hypothetical protein